jgi:hypothetical protein
MNLLYDIPKFSSQKYSSNVIERCLDCCDEATKDQIVEKFCDQNFVQRILFDMYGNYVLQKVMLLSKEPFRTKFFNIIGPIMENLKVLSFGPKLYNKLLSTFPALNMYVKKNNNSNNNSNNNNNLMINNKKKNKINNNINNNNVNNNNINTFNHNKFVNRNNDNTFINEKMKIRPDPNKSIFKTNPNSAFFNQGKNNKDDIIVMAKGEPPKYNYDELIEFQSKKINENKVNNISENKNNKIKNEKNIYNDEIKTKYIRNKSGKQNENTNKKLNEKNKKVDSIMINKLLLQMNDLSVKQLSLIDVMENIQTSATQKIKALNDKIFSLNSLIDNLTDELNELKNKNY